MNNITSFLFRLTIIWCIAINSFCSLASEKNDKIVFVGCTPGNDLIKSQLGIPDETIIDFIKWNLTLDNLNGNTFVLNIIYGESQPNTLGFKDGGQKKSYQGEYHITKDNDKEIYQLKSSGFQTEIELIKLNANIFHLLTPQKQLMIGNGGWSYTLNNKTPDKNNYPLPTLTNSTSVLKDTSLQVIYEGRTPCRDFAAENNLTVNQSCFKLKWKLILSKDPKTLHPTTYTLRRTNSRESDITGNWTIIKGATSNPDAIILQLDPDKPNQTISLLVGDENILFFLHKDKNLFIGNDNFSFTLNKRLNTTK
ncbi:MAG: hypothetical protein KF746_02370 [Chitinophagaceae bacterium]|nr:hypothetical protein [Chitinophagaceae bacterium]